MSSTLSGPRPGVRPAAEESFRATVQRLGAAQKGAKGAPAYSRFVNRRLGRVLAALAFRLGLTPDAVTGISAALTGSGVLLLALAPLTWTTGVGVAAPLVAGYAFDAADGQLARLRGGGSPAGEWLDHVVDAAKISTLHLAVAVAIFRDGRLDTGWVLVPLGFSAVASVHFFATLLNDQLRRQHGARADGTPGERAPVWRSLLVVPTDYGLLCVVFVLLGAPTVFLAGYGLLFAATAGYLALALRTWRRQMLALGRPGRS